MTSRTDADLAISRRAAVATFWLAMLFLVLPMLVLVFDLGFAVATGVEGRPIEGGAYLTRARYRGLLAVNLPWWYFLIGVVAWVIVLAAVWRVERYFYVERWGRRAILFSGPPFVAVLSLVTALWTWYAGTYFTPAGAELPYSLVALAYLVVAIVAASRSWWVRSPGR